MGLRSAAAARAAAAIIWAVPAANMAIAADLTPAPVQYPVPAAPPVPALVDPAESWEARIGAYAHGVGSIEFGTVDVNGELVTPRLSFGVESPWKYLLPRLHAGVNANTAGKTSVAYAGLLWTVPLVGSFFGEGFFGGAIHNGQTDSTVVIDPNRVQLGCSVLFHVGGSLGYRFTSHWSAMATFDHVSDGNSVFGTGCVKNQGLNNYGLRVGYAF